MTRASRARPQCAWLALVCGAGLLGCGRIEPLEACNIAKKDCQESIYYAVIRLRGDGWDPFDGIPPIKTITLEQYKKQLLADQAAAAPADPNAKPKFDPWSVALQLVGLVTPTMSAGQASVASDVSNVAAFYSSLTRMITVIDRGDIHDDRNDTTLLAHELVHAFQDNELSGDIHGNTTDGSFTARALIEGEAVLYEHLVGAELDQVEPQQLDWTKYYRDWTANLRKAVPSNTSPFYAVAWFVYPFGADFLTNGWLSGGNASVRKLAAHFPTRSVDLMAALDGTRAGSAAALSCNVQPPADMFSRTGYDRFGGMQLYAFLTAAGVDEAAAWKLGKRWRDDIWWIYSLEATQKVALSWRVRMADKQSADAVVDAAAKREHIHAERSGNDVLIVGANDDALLDWPGATDCN